MVVLEAMPSNNYAEMMFFLGVSCLCNKGISIIARYFSWKLMKYYKSFHTLFLSWRNERAIFCVKTHKEFLTVLNMQRNADMQGNQGTKALSGLGVHFPAGPTGILFYFCFWEDFWLFWSFTWALFGSF